VRYSISSNQEEKSHMQSRTNPNRAESVDAMDAVPEGLKRRNHLMRDDKILERLHPRESDSFVKFASPDGFDFVADDTEFWSASEGWKGLLRKRHNAKCLVQLCQRLKPVSDFDRNEVRIMTARAIMISLFTLCSILEFFPRLFIRDFPHSCARTATQIYWDMERRATLLCTMYRPDLLKQLYQVL
jgi:hypothetical protein